METLPPIAPDWGMGQDAEFLMDKVELGDGYVQRRPQGINPLRRSWDPSWSLLSRAEKDQLVNFLYGKLGVEAFLFKDPDSDEVFKVVCEKAPKVTYTGFGLYSVTADFEEDFNP